MSFELVYTSVRRGLREGSAGFCTVAATDGIPRLLHEKLESLSGYRHSEISTGRESPVNYSHVTIRIQRSLYHVVSRIGDAGIDYSGRTNKIAHHLALTSDEVSRFPQGPAPLLYDDEFWYLDWDTDPEWLPAGRLPRPQNNPADDFSTWEAVFGDAGWAGILGKAAADGHQTVSVIVPSAESTMDLLNEALQLVVPADRWKVCFSTYFSQLTPGTECHWRFILDGTREARRLRARSPGILVDPGGSAGKLPEEDDFVQAARDGEVQRVYQKTSEPSRSGGRAVPVRRSGGREMRPSQLRRKQALEESRRRRHAFDTDDDDEDLDFLEEYDPKEERSGSGVSKSAVIWIVMGLLVTSVLVLGVIAATRL